MIEIPPVNATEKDLEIIGADVDCGTDKNAGCQITSITDGITLSVAAMEPSPLATTLTFDTLVPSLGEAHGSAIPASSLHPEVDDATPTPGGPFLAFFDYSGGELSAVGYCGRGAFKKATLVQRRFARTVTLLGTTSTAAQLTVSNHKLKKTATFSFVYPDYIHITVYNMPHGSATTDHFPLYSYLFSSSAAISLPEVDTTEGCKGKGTVVGCSDSRWP